MSTGTESLYLVFRKTWRCCWRRSVACCACFRRLRATPMALARAGKLTRPSELWSMTAMTCTSFVIVSSFLATIPSLSRPSRNSSGSSTPGPPRFSGAKSASRPPRNFVCTSKRPKTIREAICSKSDISSLGNPSQSCRSGGLASGSTPLVSSKGSRHLPSYTPFSKRACSSTASSRCLSITWKARFALCECACVVLMLGEITGPADRLRFRPSACGSNGRALLSSSHQRVGTSGLVAHLLGGSKQGSIKLKP
mmetsp:Transcript_76445/g.211166  ORF Transcript_76445/g.211166 Transcript_76445/m.211166 type:complete len:253 (+) Transcript_76445:102-860(+)